MSDEAISAKRVQPATGSAIEYKAFARSFGPAPGGGRVLYLIATCFYPVGGYELFFQPESRPDTFMLMEQSPGITNQLVTYYIASWTSGQRLLITPSQVEISDAQGLHRVAVVPWESFEREVSS
jgi:hypothetical protein